jgi:hypothetical protein
MLVLSPWVDPSDVVAVRACRVDHRFEPQGDHQVAVVGLTGEDVGALRSRASVAGIAPSFLELSERCRE